jgi:hypothetical protein
LWPASASRASEWVSRTRAGLDQHEAQVQRGADREGATEVLGDVMVMAMRMAMIVVMSMVVIMVIVRVA